MQTRYNALDEQQWEKIKKDLQHLDLSEEPNRFGRGTDGKAARGQEGQDIAYQMAAISKRLQRKDPQHPLAKCALAMTTLYQWMSSGMLHPNAGLDIDHSDNWAQDDSGNPIMLDPIYTVKPDPKAARYALPITPFQGEPTLCA